MDDPWEESLKLALGWSVLGAILWKLVKEWAKDGPDAPGHTLYPTPMLVRIARWTIVGLFLLFWGIVLGDWLIYR